jgi:hypothetical protein
MKKINDFESYLNNPSKILDKDLKKLHFVKKGEVNEFVSADGELVKYQKLGDEVVSVIDAKEYRKLYVEELTIIKELSTAGLKVLCYILKNIGAKKDDIAIHLQDCLEFTGYKSKVNVYNGIIELLDKKLLFRKVGSGNYFINVNSFYNGKRT